ncbi:DUF937 domain-containing protein [Nonomuraea guangzhouensis]|uniref:DUF937 domain-containing protein n=1 Tax=Nonomuraea guangzhouensis TaxID=1291555 RepID=A0ABW4GRI9_9ACTN|nr:DUF937 domain-containing protein [Nonomuraea guangzhouensis]
MTLHDELLSELGDAGLEEVAGLLGTDIATAHNTLTLVSGTIVGGLARNAAHPDGAEALRGALDDHVDADPFNGDVASLSRDGLSILGHVLGGQGTEQAAEELSRLVGVDSRSIMRLLPLVAPMIMSLLAVRATRGSMGTEAVAEALNQEDATLPDELRHLLAGIFDNDSIDTPGQPNLDR